MTVHSPSQSITQQASNIASDLLVSGKVQRVELFGSLARGNGNVLSDIDLIVVTKEPIAAAWLDMVNDGVFGSDVSPFEEDIDVYTSMKSIRLWWAAKLLGQSWLLTKYMLDVFLFPPDWRDRLDELQRFGHHRDPNFMHNIAHDAVEFDELTRMFPTRG